MADKHLYGRISDWLIRHKERVAILAVGHIGLRIEEFLFDWLLYGTVSTFLTHSFGAVYGSLATFAAMCPLSALVCFWYIKLYDLSKTDWFGLEATKKLRDDGSFTGIGKWFHKLARLGDVPAFIALSIYSGPFTVTAYMRRGSEYAGLSKRDWEIFWASVLFSNAYWSLQWGAMVEVFRLIVRTVT